jgi:NitT/TauT family transport system ATP-binding protein
MNIALSVDNISQYFGPKSVLHNVNLHIPVGEFVSLVGPSGCGKSTLLKAILGTDLPKKGNIYTDTNAITGPTRDVGIVYQHYSLYDFLTAEENVAFGLALDQTSPFYRWCGGPFGWWKLREKHLRESREMLTKLKLGYLTSTYPIRMSGGERQRVAIGQALIMQPKILLLDEPLGALDEGTRAGLQDLLRSLRDENEKIRLSGGIPPYTMLIVTHELNEAIYLSDRIIGLSQYHSEGQHGSTIVYDRPATAFDQRSERDYTLFVEQKDELMNVVFNTESKLDPKTSGYIQPELSRK